MSNNVSHRPVVAWVLIVLLLFIGLGAVISGAMLFVAPDGHLMQWSTNDLAGTPFPNYLIPGIILFTFIGIFPLIVGYSLIKSPDWRWPDALNPVKKKHWAWTASWATGIIMLIWIGVETILLGYISFLQPVIAVYGVLIILLTLLPNISRYYTR
ncbi:MAG: hypothetical protein PHF74_07845 [Dehalococcoidales bacterium]|nr:hypothetical protein [Dehalococcoidales bacterium]